MTVRVDAAPAVLSWALDVSGAPADTLRSRFGVDRWITQDSRPTLKQLEDFATASGVPFGYLLLDEPPVWRLPIPDFREGFASPPRPSTNLIAVLNLAQRRQDWHREYAITQGAEPVPFVGFAADATPGDTAADIRSTLGIEVDQRTGGRDDTRKLLLRQFEAAGGLTIATSMVANNTHRTLDPDEFRGFTLVDDIAPLVFVNTNQSLNGQIFTLAHEFAHVWRGTSGVSTKTPDPRHSPGSNGGATLLPPKPSSPPTSCATGTAHRRPGHRRGDPDAGRPVPLRHPRWFSKHSSAPASEPFPTSRPFTTLRCAA